MTSNGTARAGPAALRAEFEASRTYPLDDYQRAALDVLDGGCSVLVVAPTGSGKTVVAEYAVAQALAGRRRAFYTTPLKALSNQKYADFAAAYGRSAVGLLTGDVSLNPAAAVVVMTTEVLRNMIYADPDRLGELGVVVLDEVHFLEDRYRGSVWEEIILSAPESVTLVCLSATVSNASELAAWIESVRGTTGAVIEEHRPIELRHLYVVGDRTRHDIRLVQTIGTGVSPAEPPPWPVGAGAAEVATRPGAPGRSRRWYRPNRVEVLERFAADDLLPAIYFVFSRAGCDDAVRHCLDGGVRLTSAEERQEIRALAARRVAGLSGDDLAVLGYRRFVAGLEAGVAAHHAGMVPPFREIVEGLFSAALVKVVFATETLALGINMPARSVVIESLSKFGGNGHKDLTPGEYTQLTGRAGRRGIDAIGYGAVVYSPFHSFEDVAALAAARTRPLRSSFRPTYNMAVNLVRRYDEKAAFDLVASSFAQFVSERPLSRQLEAVLALLGERGYVEDWSLTTAGRQLAGVYHDCDLLLVEAVRADLFRSLDAASLAALVSLFTFASRRRPSRPVFPSGRLAHRAEELEGLAEELRSDEQRLHLPLTRNLDAGFAQVVFDWARGAELSEVLERGERRRGAARGGELSGGDFVRNVKQLVDVLRQLGTVFGDGRTGRVARQAAELLQRGIVLSSNEVGPAAGGGGPASGAEEASGPSAS